MAPLNFSALKAKAADAAGDLKTKSTSKPVQYKPVTPWDPAATSRPTANERFEQSTVLQHQAAIHRPPPPPKRLPVASENAEVVPAASAPPRLPYRSPSSSDSTAPSPFLPARNTFGGPPPPPPPRNSSSDSHTTTGRSVPTPPVPPPSYNEPISKPSPPPRTTRASPPSVTHAAAVAKSNSGFVKFSQYGSAEKEELFAMLDEFFEAFEARLSTSAQLLTAASTTNYMPRAAISPPPNVHAPAATPPPVTTSTRPSLSLANDASASSSAPSYPPPQSHSSSALALCHWILYSPYESEWYNESSPMPTPIRDRQDVRYGGSWMTSGSQKSVLGFALFGDCSCAWWRLSFEMGSPSRVEKLAKYRPNPQAWDGQQLFTASETYGPRIVDFARAAVASGRPVARGECWDVAAEALNHINIPGVPEPFPSIGRTHGHLIYYGKAGGKGFWRGQDPYIRAGDIVEWRSVTIRQVGMSKGSWSTLGDPDHTAVIVEVGQPNEVPTDGQELSPEELADLTVVEQSLGKVPSFSTYDMKAMSKGEVWIYRPVSLVEYVGTEIKADWPPKCQSWEVGQLE